MRRRDFNVGFGSAIALLPLPARTQQPVAPTIGFLSYRSAADSGGEMAAFREGLAEIGYIERRNVTIEYRWADGRFDRLPTFAAELVRRPVAVLVAVAGAVSAAKAATNSTPIVFGTGLDPVEMGIVRSVHRPGANITGATFHSAHLGAKRLGLLREIAPRATVVALLVNMSSPMSARLAKKQVDEVLQASRTLKQSLLVLRADNDEQIDITFATLDRRKVGALLVGADPFFDTRRVRLVSLAAQYAVPSLYQLRDYAVAGGLISYGASIRDMYRQVGVYTGRILNGEKAQDLPILLPTKFELVVNLKTAKALRLAVPESILVAATEIIE